MYAKTWNQENMPEKLLNNVKLKMPCGSSGFPDKASGEFHLPPKSQDNKAHVDERKALVSIE